MPSEQFHPAPDQLHDFLGQHGFRLFAEQSEEYAVFVMDGDGVLVNWNPGARRILGYAPEDILGQRAAVIFTEEDRARGAPEHELETARAEGRAGDFRWHCRKDGSRFWADGVLTALHGGGGELLGFCKVLRDATERKLSEERLAYLASLVETSDVAIIGKELGGTIRSWNPAAESLYGYSAAEAVGQPISVIVPDDRRAELDDIMGRLRRGERVDSVETERRAKDGRRVPIRLTVSPVRDEKGRSSGPPPWRATSAVAGRWRMRCD